MLYYDNNKKKLNETENFKNTLHIPKLIMYSQCLDRELNGPQSVYK